MYTCVHSYIHAHTHTYIHIENKDRNNLCTWLDNSIYAMYQNILLISEALWMKINSSNTHLFTYLFSATADV